MSPFLQGILLGITLSILVGPLLVALIQAAVEKGFKAGMAVGMGIWISDLLFIVAVYFGVSHVLDVVQWPNFESTVSLAGGIILMLFGLGMLLIKPKGVIVSENTTKKARVLSALSLFMQGFLMNTVNPFSVFFWLSVMTSVVVKESFSLYEATLFFSGVLGTIVFTDTIKVVLAKKIKTYLHLKHVFLMRKLAGLILLGFGIALIGRMVAQIYL